jgi:hypothetical protein
MGCPKGIANRDGDQAPHGLAERSQPLGVLLPRRTIGRVGRVEHDQERHNPLGRDQSHAIDHVEQPARTLETGRLLVTDEHGVPASHDGDAIIRQNLAFWSAQSVTHHSGSA